MAKGKMHTVAEKLDNRNVIHVEKVYGVQARLHDRSFQVAWRQRNGKAEANRKACRGKYHQGD